MTEPSNNEDLLGSSSKDKNRVSLYQSRQKIFVHYVGGFWQKLRMYTGWPLLLAYFLLPWIEWHERQAVLFDLPTRKFYIFGLTLWPQDFVLLAFVLIISAFTLFFITSLIGRLWCGYTCPQTVWTAIFLWIEKFAEGSRNRRIRLEKQPWGLEKILRRSAKHGMWIVFSLLTGITFVAYFSPIRELLAASVTFDLSFWEATWIVFFTLSTYVNAGWLREQVCIYLCPYARFQSAMIDKSTLVVAYDKLRGEPRSKRSNKRSNDDLGDCVNCQLCVQVCPTGIDIRNGLQIECIQCAHCIDACDQVMQKLDLPKGLIRYDSEENMNSKGQLGVRLMRTRTLAYAAVLVLMIALFLIQLGSRVPFSMDVSRERGALYHQDGNEIRNDYTLKIANKSQQLLTFDLKVKGAGIALKLSGLGSFEVAAGDVETRIVSLSAEKRQLSNSINNIILSICEASRTQCVDADTRFLGPQ